MIAALALLLAVQQPQVSATADRTTVAAGDTIALTIRVEAESAEPVRISDPALSGLTIHSARQTSSVEFGAAGSRRVTTRVLRLVAVQVGLGSIGPARVIQGSSVSSTAPIGIEVTGDPTSAPLSAEALQLMVQRAPPPPTLGEVAVTLLATPNGVTLGQQVDLLAVAWFPRETRSRMRTPATFESPRVEGVWSYRNVTPAGVVASRRVGNTTYDLFVQHETLFPLHEGPLTLGPAAVSYSFPLTVSFLSREVRHVVQSDTSVIAVRAFPTAGRPAAFRGAAGTGVRVEVEPTALELAVGEGRSLVVTVTGRGNVALWPEPEFRWPTGLRVYPEDVRAVVNRDGLQLEGTKTFTYLVVADSVGAYRIPPVEYPYFDGQAGRYLAQRTLALEVSARPGAGRALPAVAPPGALTSRPFALPWSPRAMPGLLWVIIAVVPPGLALATRLRWTGRRRGEPAAARRVEPDSLQGLERRFAAALERLVPAAGKRDADELIAALRAAGIEEPRAVHVARLRDRLRHTVYGGGGTPDTDELLAEVREVLAGQLGEYMARQPRAAGVMAGLLVAALIVSAASGPNDSARFIRRN